MSKKCNICGLNYQESDMVYCRKCGSGLHVAEDPVNWEFLYSPDVCGLAEMACSLLDEAGIMTQLEKTGMNAADMLFPKLMVDSLQVDRARELLRTNGFV